MVSPHSRSRRTTRLVMVALACGLTAVLGTARWLRPDPRGFGTHTQLGLYPCAFLAMTGYRCPSCGMTTAFAWSVRGRFDRAWAANPAGSLLALACGLLIPWLLAGAIRGRPLGARTLEGPLIGVVVLAVTVSLGAWIFRLPFWRVFG